MYNIIKMKELKIYFTSIKGRRRANEDRDNIILNINGENPDLLNLNFFGIYDGHGGSNVSNYLKSNISKYYMNNKNKLPFDENFHNKIFESIQNQLLKNKFGYTSGSTCLLNLMYKYNDEIHMNIINLGDSRLTIIYSNWISKQITTDHKPEDPIEKLRVEQMGGKIYKDSESVFRVGDLSLSRAFGDGDNAPYISHKPDIYLKKITPFTKYIVMACDGLWDVIESAELGKIIYNFELKNSENLAVDLANLALERGSTDNISIIIIEII